MSFSCVDSLTGDRGRGAFESRRCALGRRSIRRTGGCEDCVEFGLDGGDVIPRTFIGGNVAANPGKLGAVPEGGTAVRVFMLLVLLTGTPAFILDVD
jgi:hypothetical protein